MNGSATPSDKKHLLRNVLAACALLLVLVVLLYAFRSQILTGVADFLIVNDQPLQPADVLFVLNGDYDTRPFRAAELYAQGLAPEIVIARAEVRPAEKLGLVENDTAISVAVMEKLGIPPANITVLQVQGGVTSTFDEAAALRQYIQEHHPRRIILVTSLFHTRRARWIFEEELSGLPVRLEMAAVPYADFDRTNWWQSENGLVTLNNEYIKLVYYLWKYR